MEMPNEHDKALLETTRVDKSKAEMISLNMPSFKRLLALGIAHASHKENRYYLQNLHMRVENDMLVVVGTDGIRFVRATAPLTAIPVKYEKFVIDPKVEDKLSDDKGRVEVLTKHAFAYVNISVLDAKEILKKFSKQKEGPITIFTDGDHIAFFGGGLGKTNFQTRNVASKFVHYKHLLASVSKAKSHTTLEVNVASLTRLVKLATEGADKSRDEGKNHRGGKYESYNTDSWLTLTLGGKLTSRKDEYDSLTITSRERISEMQTKTPNDGIFAETKSVIACKIIGEKKGTFGLTSKSFYETLKTILDHSRASTISIVFGEAEQPLQIDIGKGSDHITYIMMPLRI